MRADPRRRSVLAVAAAAMPLLAAGCKGVGALGTPPRPGPEVAVLRAAIRSEHVMITKYRSTIISSAALAATLQPMLSQHQAHLRALRSRLVEPAGATASPRAAPSATAEPGGDPLTALAAAEEAAAGALVSRLAVVSPSLAQLLASVAASEASHALLLRTHRSAG